MIRRRCSATANKKPGILYEEVPGCFFYNDDEAAPVTFRPPIQTTSYAPSSV